MTTVSIAIEDEASTASLSHAELIAILQALTEADKIALMKIARFYARRTPFDPDDLLQEAICRVLSGKRVWARGAPFLSFLVGVMRSVAWEWKSEPRGEVVDAPDSRCGESAVMASIDTPGAPAACLLVANGACFFVTTSIRLFVANDAVRFGLSSAWRLEASEADLLVVTED